jgi:hypothetical protein
MICGICHVCLLPLACPGFHQSEARIPLFCTGSLDTSKAITNIWVFWAFVWSGPSIFVNRKQFWKEKKNQILLALVSHRMVSNSIPPPKYDIFIAFSIDTHIGYPGHHIVILWYWLLCWSIWVCMERAIQIWQSDEGIELIGSSSEIWEQQVFDGIFSFCIFLKLLCIYNMDGPDWKMLRKLGQASFHPTSVGSLWYNF